MQFVTKKNPKEIGFLEMNVLAVITYGFFRGVKRVKTNKQASEQKEYAAAEVKENSFRPYIFGSRRLIDP